MPLSLNLACNPSFFDFKGHVTADQSPPTNFASQNAFVSCLTADTLIANTILTDDGLLVITGAINIGVGLGIIPPKPGDVSGSDIVHKSLLFIAPIIGTDGASVITISAPSVVVGPTPATSTDDAVVCWDGTTGRLVKNSTVICSEIVSGPVPATSTDDAVVCWDGTSGRLVKNSTVICADVVSGPASSTDNAVVLWDGVTGKLIKDSTLIGNAPSVGGLTLVGDFLVPETITALTLTGTAVIAFTPSAPFFTVGFATSRTGRFGQMCSLFAVITSQSVIPISTLNNVGIVAANAIPGPTILGVEINNVYSAGAIPIKNGGMEVYLHGVLSATPGVLSLRSTAVISALGLGTTFFMSQLYWIDT